MDYDKSHMLSYIKCMYFLCREITIYHDMMDKYRDDIVATQQATLIQFITSHMQQLKLEQVETPELLTSIDFSPISRLWATNTVVLGLILDVAHMSNINLINEPCGISRYISKWSKYEPEISLSENQLYLDIFLLFYATHSWIKNHYYFDILLSDLLLLLPYRFDISMDDLIEITSLPEKLS